MSDKENPQANRRSTIHVFNAKELGLSLREVAVDVIQHEDQDIESRWYRSSKDVDLFIWKDEDQNLIKQQVTFYGQLIEWNVMEGLRTGLLIEDETSAGMGRSPLIRYDIELQQQALEQGVEIVAHIPGLPDRDKYKIISNFIRAPFFAQFPPEEIMQRYGIPEDPSSSSRRPWKPLLAWRRLMKSIGLLSKKK